jgi:hypothetical protein
MAPNDYDDITEDEEEEDEEEEEVAPVRGKRSKKWKVSSGRSDSSSRVIRIRTTDSNTCHVRYICCWLQDPNKPKRAMSAFFLYSQGTRTRTKEENPEATFGDLVSEFVVILNVFC